MWQIITVTGLLFISKRSNGVVKETVLQLLDLNLKCSYCNWNKTWISRFTHLWRKQQKDLCDVGLKKQSSCRKVGLEVLCAKVTLYTESQQGALKQTGMLQCFSKRLLKTAKHHNGKATKRIITQYFLKSELLGVISWKQMRVQDFHP
jgi:hypothetical protein